MQVGVGLPMLAAYTTHVSLLLIGQHDLVDFFMYQPFLPIGWRIV
jgi:hypothetical protein